MSKIQTTKSNLINHKEYIDLLTGVKARIQSARIATSRSVNKELILLYWDIGRSIVERQKDEGWGKSVVEQLSKDIQKEFSGVTGYSPQNLWLMRQLYCEYTDDEILLQPVTEIVNDIFARFPNPKSKSILLPPVPENHRKDKIQILQQLVREIPWGHNILIFTRIKDIRERLYYILASAFFGWSRSVLLNQIKAQA